MVRQKETKEKLAPTTAGAVKQLHVLGRLSLAGFEVIIGGRF
jgi:hypothetical protein